MSLTVQSIYETICHVLLEDGNLILGLYTQAQFLNALSVVLLDFSQKAPLDKAIFTEMIVAGVSDYVVPEDMAKPELCFVGGKIIEKATESDLSQGHYEWKRQWGPPRQWHEDNLAPKHVEVFPIPDFNGANLPGDLPPIGHYGDFFPSERNLTIVGPSLPSKTAWAIGDTLDGIPDSFGIYLGYGVLEQIFNSESELRDVQRALYCHTRYNEGIQVSMMLADLALMEEDDD